MKYFVAINFSENFKSLREEQNLRKVVKLLYIQWNQIDEVKSNSTDNCIHHDNVVILNLFDPEPVIKNKLKGLINEFKKFKIHTILDYEKRMTTRSSIRVLN